jgi:hypothetical protein
MFYRLLPAALCVAAIAAAGPVLAHAEKLLMERVQQENGVSLPARGTTMARVEQQYGAPREKLSPAGGDAPQHPVINRWVYDRFTVYFEKDRVISAVVNKASPTEIGPKGSPTSQ